ncbi:unnamed protein product [Linum tenue]|uniref:Uncharacterized protein n=1 Tax=Linum tenue TaxID=586396 RepID=A0AAV0HE74_9ROSI|nr:unnamed protein product [Linum tenue]
MAANSLSHHNKSLPLSNSSQSVKKATKLIAPILFFFVLLQHSAYVFPLFLELSSTVVDKNYMFIVCNGILVLIAKSSGLIGNGEKKKAAGFDQEMEDKQKLEEVEEEEVIAEGERREEEGKDCSFIMEEAISEGGGVEKVAKDCSFITEELISEGGGVEKVDTDCSFATEVVISEGQREKEEDKDSSFIAEEVEGFDYEQGEHGNGLLSSEELQRKCEDFIRKMKAGIKFEAQQQQQLIMVQ